MRTNWLCAAVLVLLMLPRQSLAGNLSGAMKSAASGDGRSHHRDDSDDDDDGDYSCDDDDSDSFGGAVAAALFEGIILNFHGATFQDVEYGYQFPMDAELVVPFNGVIDSMTRFSMTLMSVESERVFVGLYCNGGLVNMTEDSLVDRATTSASTLGFGLAFRYYILRTDTPWNPYLSTRVGWQDVGWSYRNDVLLDDGGRISGDRLFALDNYAGVGVAWHRESPFSVFTEIGFGGTLFSDTTTEGFHNDVFESFPYFAAKVGMSFKF